MKQFTAEGVGSVFASTGNGPDGLAFDSAGNLYAGNGISVFKFTGNGTASNNLVEGNLVGTDRTGSMQLGNASDGIGLANWATSATAAVVIGGTDPNSRNIISGNGSSGVFIGSIGGANHNTVAGNFLGTFLSAD